MLSYEVPLHYGLLDKATMMDQRYSSTMNDEAFARKLLREYTVMYIKNLTQSWKPLKAKMPIY